MNKLRLLFIPLVLTFLTFADAQSTLVEKSISLPTGVTLNYVEHGQVSKTPLVLLHGFTDSWRSFEHVITKFSKDYYVVAITHRGHGGSSKPEQAYKIKDYSDDVAAFISKKGLKKCIVVGHSLGGLIAQQFAITNPEKLQGIVLVATDASFTDNPGLPEFIDEVNKLSDPIAYDFAALFQRSTIYKPVDFMQVETFIRESLKVPSATWKATGAEIMKTDLTNEIAKITAPTLILWGNRDSLCQWTDQGSLASSIPNAALKVYKDVGHAIHWENPEQFVKDVEKFSSSIK